MTAICRNAEGTLQLGLTEDGNLMLCKAGNWEPLPFNSLYAGYYPACVFTAAAHVAGLFHIAGNDAQGNPHVFSSVSGGVWEERPLVMHSPMQGLVRASGKVVTILEDRASDQVFLLCTGGQLVTLPDCPKCVRIRALRRADVSGGQIIGDRIEVRYADGSTESVPVTEALQFHISESLAAEKLRQGAVLVDLRSEEEPGYFRIPGAVSVLPDDLDLWLQEQPGDRTMLFLCRNGVQSEAAVRYARRMGYRNSYNLGGILDFTRVK